MGVRRLTPLLACTLLAAGCGGDDGGVGVRVPGASDPARLGPAVGSSARDAASSVVEQSNQASGAVREQVRAACVQQAQATQSGAALAAAVAACGR